MSTMLVQDVGANVGRYKQAQGDMKVELLAMLMSCVGCSEARLNEVRSYDLQSYQIVGVLQCLKQRQACLQKTQMIPLTVVSAFSFLLTSLNTMFQSCATMKTRGPARPC